MYLIYDLINTYTVIKYNSYNPINTCNTEFNKSMYYTINKYMQYMI